MIQLFMTQKANKLRCLNDSSWNYVERQEQRICLKGDQGMSELRGLLKAIWPSSLILQLEELSSEEEKHLLVSPSRARSHASFQ